ncbi:MAG TPA: histidinol dehydrogenase [Dehalococcoidia bacterium]|nr:histidinol dehydrogenase [Dehalococcoidia bacterium]
MSQRSGEGFKVVRIVIGAEEARRTILKRGLITETEASSAEAVRRIIDDVRAEGDAAVRRHTEAFDGAIGYDGLEVPQSELQAALRRIAPELRAALEMAAGRIRGYHEKQLKRCLASYLDDDGLGVQVRAIETVGFYAPGTQPAYPSSVLHTVVPAQVAGVQNVIVVSPAAPDGRIPDVKLAAAAIAGAGRVFCASGAQAVAALAYGTQTIPRVDKICGPGNLFVTLAKRAVYGDVGIDSVYGPTETVIVADETADPAICAVDLIAQAEHDELAAPIFITSSQTLAEQVVAEVDERLAVLPRGAVAGASLNGRGGAVVAANIEEAVELASEYAPEHLCILARDARRLATLVKNAGGVFIGEGSPEAIGDYTAGPSHVMPTGGAARFASPLSVQDFLKFSTVIDLADDSVYDLGPPGAIIARAEGLVGHARAIEERLPK